MLVSDYQLLERTCYLQLEVRTDYLEDRGNRFFQNLSDHGYRVSNQKTTI